MWKFTFKILEEILMEEKFREIIENVKSLSRKKKRDGFRCCANQLLNVAIYLENELQGLELKKKESA